MINRISYQPQGDIMEQSSSDQLSAWHFPRKNSPYKRYYYGKIIIGSNNTRIIPKLLLPNVLRPAMYSLHGFIPRPSLNKITTTEPPLTTKGLSSYLFSKRNKSIQSTESSSSNKKRIAFVVSHELSHNVSKLLIT